MDTIKKTIAWLVLLLAVARPVAAEKLNKKAERKMVQDRYERKVVVVLRDGLAVSYCGEYNPNTYGRSNWFVLPLNQHISENQVTVDSNPFGNSVSIILAGVPNCSGPQRVPLSIGDELRVHVTGVGVRGKGTLAVNLYGTTIERRSVERSVLGTTVTSLDQGEASFVFLSTLTQESEVDDLAVRTVEHWLKPFDSPVEATEFASKLKKTVTAEQAIRPADADATVIVNSTPAGADVLVDEKFFGNTPSTLEIAPGDHVILVQKAGFKAWQRTITLTRGGRVSLDATLENAQPQPAGH